MTDFVVRKCDSHEMTPTTEVALTKESTEHRCTLVSINEKGIKVVAYPLHYIIDNGDSQLDENRGIWLYAGLECYYCPVEAPHTDYLNCYVDTCLLVHNYQQLFDALVHMQLPGIIFHNDGKYVCLRTIIEIYQLNVNLFDLRFVHENKTFVTEHLKMSFDAETSVVFFLSITSLTLEGMRRYCYSQALFSVELNSLSELCRYFVHLVI